MKACKSRHRVKNKLESRWDFLFLFFGSFVAQFEAPYFIQDKLPGLLVHVRHSGHKDQGFSDFP
ncbi:hypothetical protein PC123_g14029 [Phytophthora cactorum]|nr:hypothetical protein PC123_g14029 [Phytophthora cactorum]